MFTLWQDWKEFNQSVKDKRVVFFGVADDWFEKTFQYSNPNLAYIVDNSESRKGKKYMVTDKKSEFDVFDPEVLKKKDADIYIVITSGAYKSIIPQLVSYGLKPGADFCCTPALNNLKILGDIDACTTKLLICSADHKIYTELDKGKSGGGGLYLYDIALRQSTKVLEGTLHQIIDAGDKYYVLDEVRGGLVVSKNDYTVVKEFGFEMDAKSHGMAYSPERKLIFIAKSGLDKISVYSSETLDHVTDIMISDKYTYYKKDMHHINDLFVTDRYLYVSLFSHSGNWSWGVYDGGIMEIDLDDYAVRRPLITNAWMPHSPKFIGSELFYLDSMRSILYRGNQRIVGEFSGFIRGLAHDGEYFYVGQSESRYFDKLKGIKNYISLNGGFYLFDEVSKAGKFYSMPETRQIRNLIVLK